MSRQVLERDHLWKWLLTWFHRWCVLNLLLSVCVYVCMYNCTMWPLTISSLQWKVWRVLYHPKIQIMIWATHIIKQETGLTMNQSKRLISNLSLIPHSPPPFPSPHSNLLFPLTACVFVILSLTLTCASLGIINWMISEELVVSWKHLSFIWKQYQKMQTQ